jgi:glycosyltransferase involved in cell wall biosynthesis
MPRTRATLGNSATLPGVSYVMPVLNDVAHVTSAVDSLLAQDFTGDWDITIAVGPSIDGTNELVEALGKRARRITVIDNPEGSTPAGLNIAIRHSTQPIIIRVDAHSVLPVDYARIAVQTILETDADNVGGIMDAQGHTPFEQAVARAYGTRVGLGGTRLHVGGPAGEAETVYLGVFQRERIEAVGLFDETIKRGQDWELNQRLRRAGGTVWFTPDLRVTYRPRSSVRTLVRQMFATGLWRADLTRRNGTGGSLRYLIPPVAVLGIIGGTLLGIAGVAQALLGVTPFLAWFWLLPAAYVAFVILATVTTTRGLGFPAGLWFLVVLPCIHVSWGVGFLLGMARLSPNVTAAKGR